jgi:radical SAM protein with 4Fe4S-binding SPASM domain
MKFSQKKIRNYYRFLKALRSHSEFSSEYPPYVGIETTAICNLKCNKCPVGRERLVKPDNKFMDMKLYRKIIDEIKEYSIGVCLSYFGEPLINPRFFEYVRYAKKQKLEVSFYSNGIALNERITEEIIRHEVDNIAFSVDCLPQDYEFYAHMKNVPPSIAQDQLEGIIQSIMQLMDRIKIAGVRTKVSVIHMDAPESTPLTTYENFFKGSGVSVVSGGVIDWGGTIDRVKVTRPVAPIVCHHPWDLTVSSSGSVEMCHVDYNAEHKIGDANHQTIKSIYNGEEIRSIRRAQAKHDYHGLPCEKCSHEDFGINNKLSPLAKTLATFIIPYDKYDLLRRGYRTLEKLRHS